MLRIVFLIDKLSLVVGASAATLVLPLGLIMTYEALARFLLNLPTFWAYELSYMITGAHFALGIALVTRNSEHIRIDFLYSRMPELCKEIIRNNPKKLIIIDKDEFNLYRIEQYFISYKHKAEIIYCLEDVNNIRSLDSIIKINNVEIIYHVAAYKHVPLVERNPLAAIRNNVLATNAICQSSLKNKVKKV